MKLNEITKPKIKLGVAYKLADLPALGDYRNLTVYVETGPRNAGKPSEQYRISSGQSQYDVDWIDTWMFDGAEELDEVPPEVVYKSERA